METVDDGVDNLSPGDFVVIAWRAPCGWCRSCLRGRPWYCFASRNAKNPMTLTDGTALSPALGIGAFAELTLVDAGQAVKVDQKANPAAAGLIGCGIRAGLGVAINTGGGSWGDSVAVIGCGGVGDAAIAGSKLAGAHTIIAVDIDDRKLEWAREFGATHTINSTKTDPVEAIRDLTGGNGVNVAIEAVGNPRTYEQAFYARDLAVTVVLVGVPSPDMKIELALLEVFGRGGSLRQLHHQGLVHRRDCREVEGVQALHGRESGRPDPPPHHALVAVDEFQLGQPEQVLGMVHTFGGALGRHLPVFPEEAGQLQFLQVMLQMLQ